MEYFVTISGWTFAAFLLGVMLGPYLTREKHIPRKAEVWLPEMTPSDLPVEDSGDIVPIRKKQGDTAPTWSEDTIQRGVEQLRQEYIRAGLTPNMAEIRAEVELMLNSQNGTID